MHCKHGTVCKRITCMLCEASILPRVGAICSAIETRREFRVCCVGCASMAGCSPIVLVICMTRSDSWHSGQQYGPYIFLQWGRLLSMLAVFRGVLGSTGREGTGVLGCLGLVS